MALLTAPLCFAPPLEVFLLPDVPVFLLLPEEADVLLGDAEEEPERVPVPDLPAELPEELFRDGVLLVFFCAMYILHAVFNSGSEIKIIIFVDLNIKMLAVFWNVPVVCQIKFHACMRTPPGHWKGILEKAPGPVVLKVFSVVRIVRKGVCPLISHHFSLLLSQSKRQKAPCSNDR